MEKIYNYEKGFIVLKKMITIRKSTYQENLLNMRPKHFYLVMKNLSV